MTTTQTALTAHQQQALNLLADGPLYCGNVHGISLSTVAALHRRGLAVVTTNVVHGRGPTGVPYTVRDWTAKAI